jgi:hypothetical protein
MADPPITERHKPHFHRVAPVKEPCRAATTANITISTALNNGDTLDGLTLATGDRVLVKDQSAGAENGIYVVGVTPVRAYDVSTVDPTFGYLVNILAGTANASTLWRNTNTSAPTIGATSLTFAQVSSGGASFATPAIVLGTAAAAGAASTVIRSDSTIAAFDATVPTTQALGDAAATGSAAFAARRDHKHAMPALSVATPIVASGSGATGTAAPSSREDHVHPAGAGSGTLTTVEEVDGSPTDSAVTKLVFPNGTLGITAHVATYTPSGGGGGLAQSYVGYNTIGGSNESMAVKSYGKSVTLAATSVIVGIEIYLDVTSDQVIAVPAASIWDDNSGAIGTLIGVGAVDPSDNQMILSGTGSSFPARWLALATPSKTLAAGTYWFGFQWLSDASPARIYYDGSGSDRTFSSGNLWVADGQRYTQTDSTKKYSIRVSILS